MPEARYDGHSSWYDELVGGYAPAFAALLARRAAEGAEPGDVVLDLGCGTGLYFDALRERGLRPAGVDLSADQLRLAHRRAGVTQADTARLPVRDEAFRIAVAAFIHTDVDDFEATATEVARVLRHGGRFLYVGTHPCFVAPFIRRTAERDRREVVVRRGYGDTRLSFDGNFTARVGFRSRPLAAFLGAFLGAGLRIESFEELDTEGRPWVVAPDDRTIIPWNVLVVTVKESRVRSVPPSG